VRVFTEEPHDFKATPHYIQQCNVFSLVTYHALNSSLDGKLFKDISRLLYPRVELPCPFDFNLYRCY